jgi:hypothetical protein
MTEVKKVCFNCKNCKKAKSVKPFCTIVCDVHDTTLTFPDGSTPTCNKWEEKDPTLAELRDEVRELKEQLKERKCVKIIDRHRCCEDDCCKCKCRCNRYRPYYPQPYIAPYYGDYWYEMVPGCPTVTWDTTGNTTGGTFTSTPATKTSNVYNSYSTK